MDIKSMIVDLQCYIHIRTGKQVRITPIFPQEMFSFKSAHFMATKWLHANNIKITKAIN